MSSGWNQAPSGGWPDPGPPDAGFPRSGPPYAGPPHSGGPPYSGAPYSEPPHSGPPHSGGPPWTSPSYPSARRTASRVWIGVAIGVVVTLVAGTVLVLAGVLSAGNSRADTRPVVLPDRLAGMSDGLQVLESDRSLLGGNRNEDDTKKVMASVQKNIDTAIAQYTAAFDGAAVGARSYASAADEFFAVAVAIRAPSPRLVGGFSFDLRGSVNQEWKLEQIGEVRCQTVEISTPSRTTSSSSVSPTSTSPAPTSASSTPDPAQEKITFFCGRSDDSTTVFVSSPGARGPAGLDRMARLTDAAFAAVDN